MTSSIASELTTTAPVYDDIVRASERIRGKTVRTPLLEAPLLTELLGARVLVKPECLQRTGSFKFRGAVNNIASLDDAQRRAGVVAFSSGNHAQGVARAAQLEGVPAVIVMPADAPEIKVNNTRAYGAEVVLYDRFNEDREAIGRKISEERGLTLIRPYDQLGTIAGQGTVGLEIAEQCAEMGIHPDKVLAPCGGGGLISGLALALHHRLPDAAVYGVEPKDFDDTARSLRTGQLEEISPDARSICDALLSPAPGEITFSLNSKLLAGIVTVSDEEVRRAMKLAFLHLKLVVEPGGSVGLAALQSGKLQVSGETIIVVLSGGNVDPATFQSALES